MSALAAVGVVAAVAVAAAVAAAAEAQRTHTAGVLLVHTAVPEAEDQARVLEGARKAVGDRHLPVPVQEVHKSPQERDKHCNPAARRLAGSNHMLEGRDRRAIRDDQLGRRIGIGHRVDGLPRRSLLHDYEMR